MKILEANLDEQFDIIVGVSPIVIEIFDDYEANIDTFKDPKVRSKEDYLKLTKTQVRIMDAKTTLKTFQWAFGDQRERILDVISLIYGVDKTSLRKEGAVKLIARVREALANEELLMLFPQLRQLEWIASFGLPKQDQCPSEVAQTTLSQNENSN